MAPKGISRRAFLYDAASAVAFASISGPSALAQTRNRGASIPAGERPLSASHWGVFRAGEIGDCFSWVMPWKNDSHANSMILRAAPEAAYSRSRIRYPMVRQGYLRDGHRSDTAERGRGRFVRVSWDHALDLVVRELKRVKEEFGNAAFYGGSYGWQSKGNLHDSQALLHRMLNLHGGMTDGMGDYSATCSAVVLPHVVGAVDVYEQSTVWPVILENTTLVVIWGADLLTTNAVDFSSVPDLNSYSWIKALQEKGIEVVVIDPVRTKTADYFNSSWTALRPGTDVALMMGIAHTLYAEGLDDQDFLDTYTVGFDRFRRYLTGETDGLPKTADWAAGITQIPADSIRDLARKMAANRTMLMSGWSIQRQDHGEQAHWMLITLASMLGQIGTPGAGFGLNYHIGGGLPTANAPLLKSISSVPPSSSPASLAAIPVARISDLLLNPGKTIDYNGGHITYPDIKMVYWVGGNPFHHQQERNRLIGAWRRPQTIVIHEIYWTATAKFADIVLPATTTYERNDIEQVGNFSRKFIVAMHKLLDPLFEARSDFDIFFEISQRLGYGDAFGEGKTEMEWVRSLYEDAEQSSPVAMPDFDTFWNQLSYVEFPVPESSMDYVRYADFRQNPVRNPLSTPSGRIEIYSKTIESFGYDDCPPHRTWIEPIEWLGSEKAGQYPLHMVSSHPQMRLHSQLNQTSLRKKYEIRKREPLWIHPRDAKARGIRTGDVVRVFNDRGQALAGAMVTRRVRPGVVRLQEGSWYDPLQAGAIGALCKHGDPNVLTIDKGSSGLSQGNIAESCLIEVERYPGFPPKVTAFRAIPNLEPGSEGCPAV